MGKSGNLPVRQAGVQMNPSAKFRISLAHFSFYSFEAENLWELIKTHINK